MTRNMPLFVFRSDKVSNVYCYSPNSAGNGLPPSLAPWNAVGVLRADQPTPSGASSNDILAGIEANGYQLWRRKDLDTKGQRKGPNAGFRSR